MKKIGSILLSFGLIIGTFTFFPDPTNAAVSKFKNCTELNKVYKGGVTKDAKVKNKGGKTKYAPTVSAEIYKANAGKDRDNDGIACER